MQERSHSLVFSVLFFHKTEMAPVGSAEADQMGSDLLIRVLVERPKQRNKDGRDAPVSPSGLLWWRPLDHPLPMSRCDIR